MLVIDIFKISLNDTLNAKVAWAWDVVSRDFARYFPGFL